MAVDRQHHKSKKSRYTIVLLPDEDASKAKNFHFAPWQFITGLTLFSVLVVSIVLSLFVYTPLGIIFPLSNPELENKYSKELISLNTRMMKVMEQLVDLQAYNLKLRKALGENIISTDSSNLHSISRREGSAQSSISKEEYGSATSQTSMNTDSRSMGSPTVRVNSETPLALSFPAIIPAEGYITRGFESERNHIGIDIAGKTGSTVVSAADGNIVFSGWTYDGGYVVIISHANGFLTYYKHNQLLIKTAGEFVRRGDPIATLGNTGTTSSGPHLHFEIWKDGNPVDPSQFMINLYL